MLYTNYAKVKSSLYLTGLFFSCNLMRQQYIVYFFKLQTRLNINLYEIILQRYFSDTWLQRLSIQLPRGGGDNVILKKVESQKIRSCKAVKNLKPGKHGYHQGNGLQKSLAGLIQNLEKHSMRGKKSALMHLSEGNSIDQNCTTEVKLAQSLQLCPDRPQWQPVTSKESEVTKSQASQPTLVHRGSEA